MILENFIYANVAKIKLKSTGISLFTVPVINGN